MKIYGVMMVVILYMRSNLSLEALYPKLYKLIQAKARIKEGCSVQMKS